MKKHKFKRKINDYFQAKIDQALVSSQKFKNKYFHFPPRIDYRGNLSKFASGMMKVIILLVIVGFFIGIGTGFAELSTKGSFWHTLWSAFNTIGFNVMGFLPLYFCLGLSFTIAKAEKGWATFAALFAYFSLIGLINLFGTAWGHDPLKFGNADSLWIDFAGIETYNFGIFMGIVLGIWVPWLHNRSYQKSLPAVFAFFEGPKWVITKIAFYIIAFAMVIFWIWPLVDAGIVGIGTGITTTGLGGTFLFGVLDKALLPIGVHHLIAFPIEYTKAGGTMVVDGLTESAAAGWKIVVEGTPGQADWSAEIAGVRNIINMQAGSVTAKGYITRNFTSGRILFQIGGYAGIASALIITAHQQNRSQVASITIPAAMTAAFVGISEPIEYTFLFVAPLLYFGIHVPLAGLSYVLTEVTNVSINGHALFFMIPNLTQINKVHAMSLLYLIPLYFVLYLGSFWAAIKIFKIKTPGREANDQAIKLFSKADFVIKREKQKGVKLKELNQAQDKQIIEIIAQLGTANNIVSVTNCATRLRVEVKDPKKVAPREVWTKQLGAVGVVYKKTNVQIIYGLKVANIAAQVREKLNIE